MTLLIEKFLVIWLLVPGLPIMFLLAPLLNKFESPGDSPIVGIMLLALIGVVFWSVIGVLTYYYGLPILAAAICYDLSLAIVASWIR